MMEFSVLGDVEGAIMNADDIPITCVKNSSFLIQMGDSVIGSKEENLCQIEVLNQLKQLLDDNGIPLYHVIGNHDIDNFSLKEFMDLINMPRPYTSFDVTSYHFIILNSADGSVRGGISKEQTNWLKNDLERTDKPTIVFSHHLIGKYPRQRILELNNASLIINHKEITKLLEDSGKVILVIEGHGHYRHYKHKDINYVCIGHYYIHHSLWNLLLNTEKIIISEIGIDGKEYTHINILRKRNKSYYASASSDIILSNIHYGKNILNVGCVSHTVAELKWQRSIGEWLHDRLVSVSDHVFGIDISQEGIEYMQEQGYDANVMNAEEIDIDDKFDHIIAGFVIDHLSNIGMFFEGCNRICKDDGTLLIAQKNPYAFVYLKHVFKGRKWADDNIGLFMPEHLINMAKRYRFVLDHLEYAKPREFGISKLLFLLGLKRWGGHVYLVTFKKLNFSL